ncbi:CDP-glycerol glycerophosphotransferase family protein [Jeotgalicoccus coquinae]|uniref:CDP-glycerol glycerophosphotransferase (TagB/SpsB family) n=1 Tax=Jeotgalicoccus coquinae TaxID=709509 RepID=A0A6V7RLZ5_9STAP|nr:CDP-glycerol glycerophosphotransferase family protein [Jeotgalicoccus coquinae]MBB6422452.1 CDP-glycerol glycerophosphotransferase (TagB/SpsB family) [Jeotgalicoccus coquinae]CAD2078584.1 Putative CDP-glycerol:glycerophosphate glycerophosphotransferase [Jeotgalicoccus coquinae]
MIKEGVISLYLAVTGLAFNIFRLMPLQEKTVMLASFGDNIEYVAAEVKKQTSSKIIILKEPGCRKTFESTVPDRILEFTPRNAVSFLKGLYHLATAKYLFVDNYHVVLAACNFRTPVKCIQLWHANGAVKYFGCRDKTIKNRPASAHRRFKKVYSRFHYIAVSSDEMAYIFKEAFGAGPERIIKSGVPRTDFFYHPDAVDTAAAEIHAALPELESKKILLYAPTFRDDEYDVTKIHLDIDTMKKQLSADYHLLLKLHPAVKLTGFENDEFVTDVSGDFDINPLLLAADILITDYSSIPFEFSILKKPMIFFPYDLNEYEKSRGLWFNYQSYMPGPVAFSTKEIINILKNNNFDMERIEAFNNQWNKYSSGNSAAHLVKIIYSM